MLADDHPPPEGLDVLLDDAVVEAALDMLRQQPQLELDELITALSTTLGADVGHLRELLHGVRLAFRASRP